MTDIDLFYISYNIYLDIGKNEKHLLSRNQNLFAFSQLASINVRAVDLMVFGVKIHLSF